MRCGWYVVCAFYGVDIIIVDLLLQSLLIIVKVMIFWVGVELTNFFKYPTGSLS